MRPDTPGGTFVLGEVAAAFLRLGCTSFGGPVAHLGHLRAELVERRRWLDDARYGDLVALCQFLPGPASSQLVFALGMHRAGLPGAIVASLCFTLPSAALMIGFAFGLARLGPGVGAGFRHGLEVAAVAVVAQAVWAMGQKLCTDRARVTLAVLAAGALLVRPGPLTQLLAIGGGALVGARLYAGTSTATRPRGRGHLAAAFALTLFALLLLGLPVLARLHPSRAIVAFDGFYRAGSLVFGGGHVVLPLLRVEVVPRGWLTDEAFLSGYGAAQALPGPLFTFAGYLGAAMQPGAPSLPMGLLCLFAIFLPAWLLIGGALPFWESLRARPTAQAALAGANAAVVGVLLAALYDPVITSAIHAPRDVAAALLAFLLLEAWKAPPWLVVGLAAGLGRWMGP